MAAIYSGCDNSSVWASAPTDVSSFSYGATTGETNPGLVANMSFMGCYLGVVSGANISALNAKGVAVTLFYENTIGEGPQGSLGYTPRDANYFTFNQGAFDARNADFYVTQLGLADDRPVYFTVDFSSTSLHDFAIGEYFRGIFLARTNLVGMYGNAGTMDYVRNLGYAKWFWQNRSAGQRNNDTLYAHANVWQWPAVHTFNGHTYNPDGTPVVGGHAVDGDFAYTTDFGQIPAPTVQAPATTTPPAVGGAMNNATVTDPTVTFSQPGKQSLRTPTEKYDQVVYSATFSASVSNVTGAYELDFPNTNINQYAYPIGNFSTDGGVTWNDYGFIFTGDVGSNLGPIPPVVIQPFIDDIGSIHFSVAVNATVGGNSTIPLLLNIALLVTYNPGLLPSVNFEGGNIPPARVSQRLSYSNRNPTSANDKNYARYRRISDDNAIATINSLVSVAHGQATIPNIVFWVRDTTGTIEMIPVRWSSTGHIAGQFGIKLDASNATFFLDNSLNKCYYRLYKDN